MTHHTTTTAIDPCLDTEAAASFLGLSKAQIVKLRSTGVIPAVVYGPKCIRHRLSDLTAYRDSLLRGGDGKPAMGRVHPNLHAARPKRPKSSGAQAYPSALPKAGENAKA